MNPFSYPKIILWALAGQQYEGWHPPCLANLWQASRSYRNNNPGNLKSGLYTADLGAVKMDANGFLIFPSFVAGFTALCIFLINACQDKYPYYSGDGSLVNFYETYNPVNDGGQPFKYASTVANFMGVSATEPIKNFLV